MGKLNKSFVNVGVFVLVAALIYLVGRALLAALPMWSAMMNGPMMGNGMMGGSGWPGMGFMLLFWGVVLVLVAWLLVSAFSSLFSAGRRERGSGASGDNAEATLRERFARGEISTEEYRHDLQTLRGETHHEVRESLLRDGRE